MQIFKNKWFVFVVVLFGGVIADQATKLYAEARLANISQRHGWRHELVLTVPAHAEGQTLHTYLKDELSWSTDKEVELIAQGLTLNKDRLRVPPDTTLAEGDELRIQRRTATVIEGYFDFVYARNPGAAWSFLADAEESFRTTFFRLMSLLAFGVIIVMMRQTPATQWRFVWGLSLIASGAVGNLIDRFAYGYVIDFIAWHVGDSYWPTFNIADAWITIGVALMILDLIFTREPDTNAEEGNDAAPATASSVAE